MNTQQRSQIDYWLALHHTPHCGIKRTQKLLSLVDDISELFSLSKTAQQTLGIKENIGAALMNPPWKQVEEDLNWAQQKNHHIIYFEDPRYPSLLRETAQPPLVLYLQGNPLLLQQKQLAIVGSRNPSHHGTKLANEFAQHLAALGLVITSGLATGIDSASHLGALQAKQATIAILGSGLNRIYPRSNHELADKIRESGAIVSEFSANTAPHAHHFPRRNRLISGLSIGVLVVEAALRSGSLITARFALEQNREVFAIPGSINSPLARGCHQLIRQGAKLVESINDITEELAMPSATPNTHQQPNRNELSLSAVEQQLLDLIGYETLSLEALLHLSELSYTVVNSALQALALQGIIIKQAQGFCRAP